MNQVPVLNFQDFIAADGERLTTTSLKVAFAHKKRHDNVVSLIRKRMAEAGEWGVLNFEETPQINPQNGTSYPVFTMTQAGYQFLVGKMTGRKAVEHQIAYINAFAAMASYLRHQRESLRYRCMEKELECRDSERRGSFHGKGLNQRKLEKPGLEGELAKLQALAQPALLN